MALVAESAEELVSRTLELINALFGSVSVPCQYRSVLSALRPVPAVPPEFPSNSSACTVIVPADAVVGFTNSNGLKPLLPAGNEYVLPDARLAGSTRTNGPLNAVEADPPETAFPA